MRLSYVEMHGFRGFRAPTRVSVPPGFLVVGGANGSGKSSICDAIEYAITGRLRAGTNHKERGESIREYLWWLGQGTPSDQYVEIGLVDAAGREHAVRRGPEGLTGVSEIELRALLVSGQSHPEDPLAQLCQTSILRDEEITGVSVDLKEVDRFAFVRAALGTADFSALLKRLREVGDLLELQGGKAGRDYERERERAAALTTRLSEARTEAAGALALAEAETALRRQVGAAADDLGQVVGRASERLASERRRADQLTACIGELRDLEARRLQITTPQYSANLDALAQGVLLAREKLEQAEKITEHANSLLEQAQKEMPSSATLLQVLELGRRAGLQDGRCPLCGANQSVAAFSAHVAEAVQKIEEKNANLALRTREAAEAAAVVARLTIDLQRREREWRAAGQAGTLLAEAVGRVLDEVRRHGVDLADYGAETTQTLAQAVDAIRGDTEALESALFAVRASRTAMQVVELEREAKDVQARLTSTEMLRARVAAAQAQVREADAAVRRLQGELVDEQLASIAPLLIEIYQRLRPHVDWRDVRYNLRGDVRRMLSLEVGDGLNPSFMFSSGQRRTAGLAFLLAIHLSRSWCRLDSLILDDPVQHVDDYRALHLAEVLAAIRRTGRQVICTVEDPALAGLLARRLRCEASSPGAIVRLKYEAGLGSSVAEQREVSPFAQAVLVSPRAAG